MLVQRGWSWFVGKPENSEEPRSPQQTPPSREKKLSRNRKTGQKGRSLQRSILSSEAPEEKSASGGGGNVTASSPPGNDLEHLPLWEKRGEFAEEASSFAILSQKNSIVEGLGNIWGKKTKSFKKGTLKK